MGSEMCIRDRGKTWNDTKEQIRNHINTTWQQRWDTIEGHVNTKFFYPTIDRKRSKKLLNLARLTLTIRAITGHNFLGYHQNKVDPHIYKVCRLCEEEDEKFVHILTDCPRLWLTGQEIYLDHLVTGQTPAIYTHTSGI